MTSAQFHIEACRLWARRIARSIWYPYRFLMDADDAMSAADEALCISARTYRSDRGVRFQTYAYPFIHGRVRRTISREMAYRRKACPATRHLVSRAPCPESSAMVRNLMKKLAVDQRTLVLAHIVDRFPLADIARQLRVSPSWASRRLKGALAQLRDELTRRDPT